MGVTLNWQGLDELRNALRNLPDDLANEAAVIVSSYANEAKSEIQFAYPVGPTGNLKRRVTVAHNAGRRSAAVSIVKSSAPHAWIFENGTKVRRTDKGRNRGRMPEAREGEKMLPKVIRLRARMVRDLVELVKRQGAEVDA